MAWYCHQAGWLGACDWLPGRVNVAVPVEISHPHVLAINYVNSAKLSSFNQSCKTLLLPASPSHCSKQIGIEEKQLN
jgi:hypothetical protein